jgi:hypothetical protein
LYLALHTADPGDVGMANEVSGGSYVEQPIVFGSTAGNSALNSVAVVFSGMPACMVTHFSIKDGVGGNPLFVGPLSAPQPVSAGQIVNIAIGLLSVGAD